MRQIRLRIGAAPHAQQAQRYAVDGASHSELSLGRALAEIDQLSRRHRLQDHMQPQADATPPRPASTVGKSTPPSVERPAATSTARPGPPPAYRFRENDPVQHGVYGRGVVLGSRMVGQVEQVTVRFRQRGGVVKTVPANQGQLRIVK